MDGSDDHCHISLMDLPREILINILEFLEIDELGNVFFTCKEILFISHQDSELWEYMCRVYGVDVSSKDPNTSMRKHFFLNLCPKITCLYTSNRGIELFSEEAGVYFNKKPADFIKSFDTSCRRPSNVREEMKVNILSEIDQSEVVILFGGNKIYKRDELGTYLYQYLKNTKNSVITLVAAHGSGKNSWELGGEWDTFDMNPMIIPEMSTTSHNHTSKLITVCKKEKITSEIESMKFEFNEGVSYQTKKGVKNEENSRLLMDFEGKDGWKCSGIAERIDVKHVQANFEFRKASFPLILLLIKYIHIRRKKISR